MQSQSAYAPLKHETPVYTGSLLEPDRINSQILQQFEAVKNEPDIKKTHHFMGRFENTYIPESRIPAITAILDMGRFYASRILSLVARQIKLGFWFNEMQPGFKTSLHTHEEEDELLSAVYYIQADRNSGDLIVRNAAESIAITPMAGRMILFRPEVPHQVETNNSDIMRLSVAINFGRLK